MANLKAVREAVHYVRENKPMRCPRCRSEKVDLITFMSSNGSSWGGRCDGCGSKLTEGFATPMDAAKKLVSVCKKK